MLQRFRLYADQYAARIIHDSSLKQGLGLLTNAEVGFFIQLNQYYLLPCIDLTPDLIIEDSELIFCNQILGIWQLMIDHEVVGYVLQSMLQTKCSGSYVTGFLNTKVNKKHETTVVLRTNMLSVLEFKGAGFLAISNALSEPMTVIMEEQ